MNTPHTALYISISFALALVSGCGPVVSTYETSTAHGVRSAVYAGHSSAAETYTCIDVRDAQDDETTEEAFSLLERVGLIPGAHETTVNYRLAVQLLCEQEGRRGAEREITVETCERWLADDGIPVDATGTVVSTERTSVDPRVADMILPIARARLYFGLFMADAQRYCQDREATVIAGGIPSTGFGTAFPVGASAYGLYLGAGAGLGFGGGVGALDPTSGGVSITTVNARGDIVINSYSMRTDAVATVTINGSAMAFATGTRDQHLRPAIGSTATMWSVDCTINGAPMPTLRQSGAFGIDGGRLELDVICGRW